MNSKTLLLIAHAPSDNTGRMVDSVLKGAADPGISSVKCTWVPPLQAGPEDVMACDAIILGTTENLGYMSGALKDFFDRIYYPCLEKTQGLPCALYVRAGHDGTGTRRGVESICTGLRWNWVQQPVICRGEWRDEFLAQCETLGATMASGLEAGIY